jgi:hypothetical protein
VKFLRAFPLAALEVLFLIPFYVTFTCVQGVKHLEIRQLIISMPSASTKNRESRQSLRNFPAGPEHGILRLEKELDYKLSSGRPWASS